MVFVPRYRKDLPPPPAPLSVRRRKTRIIAASIALGLGAAVVLFSVWMENWDRILEGGHLFFIAPEFLGGWMVRAETAVYLRQVGGGGLGVGVAILVGDWLKRAQAPRQPPP
jgi:hypothetical protein